MAGRKPVPTALKLIRGTEKPSRKNSAEPKPPKPARVPAPPGYLGTKGKSEWKRIAKQLHETGILTLIDTKALASYCMSYDEMLTAQGQLAKWNIENPDSINLHKSMTGNLKTHPLVDQLRQHRLDMMKFAAEFGLTPSSRSRVVAVERGGGNEFGEF